MAGLTECFIHLCYLHPPCRQVRSSFLISKLNKSEHMGPQVVAMKRGEQAQFLLSLSELYMLEVRVTERNLAYTGLFPSRLQWPVLGQTKARREELHVDLSRKWQGSKHLGHSLLLFPVEQMGHVLEHVLDTGCRQQFYQLCHNAGSQFLFCSFRCGHSEVCMFWMLWL